MTTPRKQRPTPETAAALADALGSNLGESNEVPEEFRPASAAQEQAQEQEQEQEQSPVKATKAAKLKKEVPPEHAVKAQDRLWIVLEDNDDIPPGGQFIGVDGAAFMLKPNIEAWVPVGLCDVLDAAVKSVPIQDDVTRQITGWKNRLRFPYRIVRNKKAPAGWTQPK